MIDKVTAFVLSAHVPPRLLVFKHPTAGVQLPAGTVEQGETPFIAAVREVYEETGIRVFHPSLISEDTTALGSDVALIGTTTASLTPPSVRFKRGHKVSIVSCTEDATHIQEHEYDFAKGSPRIVRTKEGWVPRKALCHQMRRSFILLFSDATKETLPAILADGHIFEPFWIELPPKLRLVEGQHEWLENNLQQLLHATRPCC